MENVNVMAGDLTKQMQEKLALGKILAQRYKAWAKTNNVPCKAFIHVDAKPGRAIVKAAMDNKVEHIILSSSGLNGIGRAILGSVSDYIVHHAQLPITLVPCPHDE